MEPQTLWQEQEGFVSGGGAMVRAAAFTIAGATRGAVTFTVRVPEGSYRAADENDMTATLLLNPDEARGFAAWLDEAAERADQAGPPLYG